MSKTKIMRTYVDAILIMMQRNPMPSTGSYDTVKLTPSSMDDPSAHFIEYRSYLLSMSVIFTLKDILGMSIFVLDDNKGCKNVAMDVVDVAIFL